MLSEPCERGGDASSGHIPVLAAMRFIGRIESAGRVVLKIEDKAFENTQGRAAERAA